MVTYILNQDLCQFIYPIKYLPLSNCHTNMYSIKVFIYYPQMYYLYPLYSTFVSKYYDES
jgi:hypothetical protein